MFQHFDPEKLLLQIAEAQTSTFIVKDLQHRYLMVNQLFADSVDMDIADIIGKNDLEIGIPETMVLGDKESGFPGFWALDDQAIKANHTQRYSEEDIAYKSGSSHDAMTTRTPLFDKNNRVIALLIQSHDVTKIRHLEYSLQRSVQIREDQLSVLNTLMARMMAYQNLDPLLQHIASVMVDYTLADNAVILMVDQTQEYLQAIASAGSKSHINIGKRRTKGIGFAGVAWSTGETQYLYDTAANTATNGYWPVATQLIAVPLLVDNVVIGVAVLGAPNNLTSFRTSTALIKSLANLAGISIANAKAKELNQLELARTRALSKISQYISSSDHPDTLMSFVTKTLIDAMEIFRASCYTVDSSGKLSVLATWQKTNSGIIVANPMPPEMAEQSIGHWCYSNKEMVHIPRNTQDPRESSTVHNFRSRLNIGSTLCMPIIAQDGIKGALLVCRDNDSRNFDENEINLFTSVVNQLSNALYSKQLSDALKHEAHHDSLTQLPNRRYFENELKNELESCQTDGSVGAIMFLDLDGFKTVNDTYGHGVGDQLLCNVSKRLGKHVQSSDFLARIGGDEFAVILRNLNSYEDAIEIASRLSSALGKVFKIDSAKLKIGASIGISYYPEDGAVANDLLRNADEAMYRSKSEDKGSIIRFDQSMADESRRRLQLKQELRTAIDKRQFLLFYQPQVDTQTGDVNSVEALIRWEHPLRGTISPGEFIPVAEEAGLIDSIGLWVIDEAISQLVSWKNTQFENTRISINVAASQFLLDDFAEQLLTKLSENGVAPPLLEIEITESVVLTDIQSVVQRLNLLRASGVRIAVDDFGTGYSSLRYLQELPLDVLKIDRSFVVKLEQHASDNSLANTIMLLAKGLGLETVAEGVETTEQLEHVSRLGCSFIQGFYFAKPCHPSELPAVLEAIQNLHIKTDRNHVA